MDSATGLEQAVNQVTNVGYAQAGPIFLPPGQGTMLWAFGLLITLKALGNETGSAYFTMEGYVRPGRGLVPHKHAGEEEFWVVQEGTVVMHIGNETHEAPAGSFMHIPRGVLHNFENKSAFPARMTATHVPGGIEGWFLGVGKPYEGLDKVPEFTDEDAERGIKLAAEYGIAIALE